MGLFSITRDMGQKFEQIVMGNNRQQRHDIWGGSVSVNIFTLDYMYREHLAKRNVWTSSNDGYDLGRYFGTTFILYRHETLDYIFWYSANWTEPLLEDTLNMAPGIAMNAPNKILVLSQKHGRKRPKKVKIKPPATLKNEWYFQKNYMYVGLFRMGLTLVNLKTPFIHTNKDSYGTWIGWAFLKNGSQHTGPPTEGMHWSYDDLHSKNFKPQGGGDLVPIFYKFWWDTGKDNAIMINTENRNPNSTVLPSKIKHIEIPYWQLVYGQNLLTAKYDTTKTDFKYNPSVYAIWWYTDYGYLTKRGNTIEKVNEGNIPHSPESVTNKRCWVFLTGSDISGMEERDPLDTDKPNIPEATKKSAMNACTFRHVQKVMQGIGAEGPFAMSASDIYAQGGIVNIALKYRSHWQWGGVGPTSDTVRDPTTNTGPANLQVVDPRRTGYYTVHPWDYDNFGIMLSEKLKQLVSTPTDSPLQFGLPKKSPQTEDERSHEESQSSGKEDTFKQEITEATENQLQQLLLKFHERVNNSELERKRFMKKLQRLIL